eukprot:TRINITY_DN12472_c0_g2_i1.p1 TRINITY_DN12472_c0_g2~~TRINITY_DN12472_c0_g2_i1.p1  ORF type:complete len:1505 (+),score=543.11 TRINITY_DN12472_c0_g2_i1:223-4737(+)
MSIVFRKRRGSMVIKSTEDLFLDMAGPKFNTLTRSRHFEFESSVDDEGADPLDDKVGVQDLAKLSELTEERINRELELRYRSSLIYTKVGDILIAVNPFEEFDSLYGEEAAHRYLHTQDFCPIPHVYGVAQRAYKSLLANHKNQCVVISGESGAGKTETAKLIVEHMLAMCKGTGALEQRIVEVNPLLEAFGNAKTVINDNSSRFGKYLEIKFGFFGEVLGAHLAEYLLEKSRVVRQADGEQNFHVFYYLFAGLSPADRVQYCLEDTLPSFHYLRGGQAGVTRDMAMDTDDEKLKEQYKTLMEVLHTVGFSKGEIADMHQILAAILHLGNVAFEEAESSFAAVQEDSPTAIVADLLGLEVTHLDEMLVSTVTAMRGERLRKNFDVEAAEENRDATAKAIYGRLFAWIVYKANGLLKPEGQAYERARRVDGGISEVGILDIFGFENFARNSFEQFCINVANEQLQYYFNQHIFASEQNVYAEEGIQAAAISYKDNGPLLDMILGRPLGLFALLDEESKFPRSSAKSLLSKFSKAKQACDWEAFETVDASRHRRPSVTLGNRGKQELNHGPYFSVQHYAGKVVYNASGFLEKNRDTVSQLVITRIKESNFALLSMLFRERISNTGSMPEDEETSMRGRSVTYGRDPSKMSVSAHFKGSLHDLINKMLRAEPHFVRCIKPNDLKKPKQYFPERVSQQLTYTGVLETTRIRRDGYALRLDHVDFLNKYQSLGLKGEHLQADWNAVEDMGRLHKASRKLIANCKLKGAQVGITKVFLKYYHAEKLMELRQRQTAAVLKINAWVRRFLAQCQLAKLKAIKAKEEAERRRQEERAEAERLRQEQLRLQQEAAERARQEAEAQAAQLRRAATMKRQAELKALEEAQRRAEEAERQAAEAAAKAEQERLEQERLMAEEQEREAEAERQAALAKEQAKVEKKERLRKEYLEAMREGSRKSIASIGTLGGTVGPKVLDLLAVADEMEPQAYEHAFDAIFDDEEIDQEEREALREAQMMRRQEEAMRKRQLQQEFEAKHAAEEEARMRELQAIQADEERRQAEEARMVAEAARQAEASLASMSFGGFSFGDAAPAPAPASNATTAPATATTSINPTPATTIKRPSPPAAVAAEPERASPVPPPVSPKPKRKEPPRISPKPRTASATIPPTATTQPPAAAVKPQAVAANTQATAADNKPKEPRRRKLVRGGNKKEAPVLPEYVDAMSALDSLDSELEPFVNTVRIKPKSAGTAGPPVKIKVDGDVRPPPPAAPTSSSPLQRSGSVLESKPPPPPTASQEQARPPPPPAPTSTVSTSNGTDAPPKEPRRRKLVRGGNKKEAPVLPEFEDAMSALDALDGVLDEQGALDTTLNMMNSSQDRNVLRERLSSYGSGGHNSHVSQEEYDELRNTLLETPPPSGPASPPRPVPAKLEPNITPTNSPKRAQSHEALTAGASATPRPKPVQRAQTSHQLSPEFVQAMDETQRIALLNLVRDGDMTIEEAINQVNENQQRKNCIIS